MGNDAHRAGDYDAARMLGQQTVTALFSVGSEVRRDHDVPYILSLCNQSQASVPYKVLLSGI